MVGAPLEVESFCVEMVEDVLEKFEEYFGHVSVIREKLEGRKEFLQILEHTPVEEDALLDEGPSRDEAMVEDPKTLYLT